MAIRISCLNGKSFVCQSIIYDTAILPGTSNRRTLCFTTESGPSWLTSRHQKKLGTLRLGLNRQQRVDERQRKTDRIIVLSLAERGRRKGVLMGLHGTMHRATCHGSPWVTSDPVGGGRQLPNTDKILVSFAKSTSSHFLSLYWGCKRYIRKIRNARRRKNLTPCQFLHTSRKRSPYARSTTECST